MKKAITLFFILLSFVTFSKAQGTANDIAVSKLPSEVKEVLNQYISILNSGNLDECAVKFVEVAGGGLVNEDGVSLRSSIKDFSLKKDFNDVKFYKQPVEITRVNASSSNGQGFGESAIKGMVYKIWIAKKDAGTGMPAPISIMVPEGHSSIKKPKVVNIGSL